MYLMDDKNSPTLILLTYKSKVLLMQKQKNPLDNNNVWSLIGGTGGMSKTIEREMGIKIENLEMVSKSCYHAGLTDENVNQITRSDGQSLAFFSRQELQNLSLTDTTREFVSKHGELIQ